MQADTTGYARTLTICFYYIKLDKLDGNGRRKTMRIIFAHNHPSGIAEPSQADIHITERLKKALALVDIRVLDHVIIGDETTCFSERGLI